MLLGQVDMPTLAAFLIASFGGFAIIRVAVSGTRLSVKPFTCAVCMGTWIGWGLSYLFFHGLHWYEYQVFGLMAAGSNWILYKYVSGEN